jgi:hypothetical protein
VKTEWLPDGQWSYLIPHTTMSHTSESTAGHTLFDDNGVLITDSHVRTQSKVIALRGSAFSRTRTTECLETDPGETARLRRRILRWGVPVALVLSAWAGWYFGEAVSAQYYLNNGRALGVHTGQAIAFAIAAGITGLALAGTLLCARVQRKYKLYHVYLTVGPERRQVACSRNEAWITAISAALDQAIARLSVSATEESTNSRPA